MLKPFALIVLIVLLLAGQSVSANYSNRYRAITFEGTLLNYSPHSGIACGALHIHQVAKYRVDKILEGKYSGKEIVVDHPACDGDVFKNITAGVRVKITVRVRRNYGVITKHPGIREEDWPKIFYVALDSPEKL